jgi:hypothetical protein
MKAPRHPTIVRRMRDGRLARLGGVGPLAAGSLVRVEVRCGRAGCRCARGRGHPAWYLTFKRRGRTVNVYVPKHRLKEVRGWIRESGRLKELAREISELTVELYRAERRGEKSQARPRRRRD